MLITVGSWSYALPSPLHLSNLSFADAGAKEPPREYEEGTHVLALELEFRLVNASGEHGARMEGCIKKTIFARIF